VIAFVTAEPAQRQCQPAGTGSVAAAVASSLMLGFGRAAGARRAAEEACVCTSQMGPPCRM